MIECENVFGLLKIFESRMLDDEINNIVNWRSWVYRF